MVIGLILAVVFIAIAVACLVAATKTENDLTSIVCGVIGLVFILGTIVIPPSFHTVNTGTIAVVKHLGEARGTRAAGTHFDLWITNSYQRYNAKVQSVDIKTATYSSDAQTMDIQMTLQYQIMPDKVVDIAKQYGSLSILQNRIESISIEKAKAVLSSYKAMKIIENRSSMSPAVEECIKDAIGKEYFVNVTAVVITNIDFSDAFEKAVEDKMVAEQKKLKAEYENETKVEQAKANAEAKVVSAEAEAKANELLEKSLTDKILREMYIEKWDGKLPNTVAGEDSSLMIPAN